MSGDRMWRSYGWLSAGRVGFRVGLGALPIVVIASAPALTDGNATGATEETEALR